ncbi:MAG: hypothetical protein PUF03_08130 [Lachnospiraceae bacterium]|nr:hypothetical protein [Lachnospiraceae bacterium]
MCCIQISDEVLLKNVMASPILHNINGGKISIGNIGKCGIYLENNLPGYVDCETDFLVLSNTAKACGYTIDHEAQIDSNEVEIEREKCNSIYPKDLADRIEKIVDAFFERSLYDPSINIVRMKYVSAH